MKRVLQALNSYLKEPTDKSIQRLLVELDKRCKILQDSCCLHSNESLGLFPYILSLDLLAATSISVTAEKLNQYGDALYQISGRVSETSPAFSQIANIDNELSKFRAMHQQYGDTAHLFLEHGLNTLKDLIEKYQFKSSYPGMQLLACRGDTTLRYVLNNNKSRTKTVPTRFKHIYDILTEKSPMMGWAGRDKLTKILSYLDGCTNLSQRTSTAALLDLSKRMLDAISSQLDQDITYIETIQDEQETFETIQDTQETSPMRFKS